MGDAKRRGTPEERENYAIVRQKVGAERQASRRGEIEATRTPEQNAERRYAMFALTMALGVLGVIGDAEPRICKK